MNKRRKQMISSISVLTIGLIPIQLHAQAQVERGSVTDISVEYYMDSSDKFDDAYDLKLKTATLNFGYWQKDYAKMDTQNNSDGGYISFSGLEYSYTELDFSSHPLLAEDEDFHQLRTSLNMGKRLSSNWKLDGYVGFAFNIADADDSTHVDGELEAGFLFRYAFDGDFNKDYIIHVGAEQSYDFGGLVPTLAVEYKQENYSFLVGLPKTSASFKINDKLRLSAIAELQGKRGFFYNEAASNEEVEFQSTAIHTHLIAEYHACDSVKLHAGVGYLFAREVDIESTAFSINESSSDGWTAFGGLTYKW